MEGQERFINEYLSGKSAIQIAKENGITREAVYLRLRSMPQWEETKKAKRSAKRVDDLKGSEQIIKDLKRLRSQGYSTTKAARELGVNYLRARTLLRGSKYDNSKKAKEYRNRNITREYDLGKTQHQLAEKYGLGQAAISHIILTQKGLKK
jgi:hypothetical protein